MRVTRENVAALIERGELPQGNLLFTIVSGNEAMPLPPLFKLNVRWQIERETPGAIVTKLSDVLPPFTFYDWNELEAEQHGDDVTLRFLVQTELETVQVRALVARERHKAV